MGVIGDHTCRGKKKVGGKACPWVKNRLYFSIGSGRRLNRGKKNVQMRQKGNVLGRSQKRIRGGVAALGGETDFLYGRGGKKRKKRGKRWVKTVSGCCTAE